MFVYFSSGLTLEFARADSFRLEAGYLVLIDSDDLDAKTPLLKLDRRGVLSCSHQLACPSPC